MKDIDGKGTNVLSKTPEEIKKGLERCKNDAHCDNCITAYHCQVEEDALAYIQHLEAERDQYKRERDAAIEEIESSQGCTFCKHMPTDEKCGDLFSCLECEDTDCVCKTCVSGEKLEWRGVKEKNDG